MLRFAADAVREAAAAAAHREAAAHYRLALEWADGLDEAERARLREEPRRRPPEANRRHERPSYTVVRPSSRSRSSG